MRALDFIFKFFKLIEQDNVEIVMAMTFIQSSYCISCIRKNLLALILTSLDDIIQTEPK